ncbi:serine/threonine-protein kinase [Burkholderia sp. AU33545]|uniref:serine/threonine protein kinase n=1 Tax=Burkholderia sp. AU33545 TaxID=2879631 RepID=UPI001CF3964D|nr:serine/threonine protein kinase [Burkholderia sp. AU33545]MCA8203977.1 serine/threonine-protein kinase [Burkholderia sp. AU33545]
MMSFAQLIQTFQSGALSQDAFFSEIDRVLATDQVDCARLREVLDQTQTTQPLSDAIYAEVLKRIERCHDRTASAGDATRIQESPLRPEARPAPPSGPSGGAMPVDGERVKGIGDTLNGRFVLEECLGVGGMGTVYKALDLRKLEASDRKPHIAIKVLNVQFRGQPTSLIALQREARKAQTLAHRNIVTVYDFDRDGPLVYLTMEYLSGRPLSKVLRAPDFKGMPLDAALPIIAGMGQALAYAHERGFVHCDFKPANVFLTDRGEVKVIDFGIARAFQRRDEDPDVTVFDPASLGGITPAYASPEMFEHLEPDPRDDVYALACVTYELLTGHHPFNRLSATQARHDHLRPERHPGLDRTQWRTLSAALSFDRATRTPSVNLFLEGMGVFSRPTRASGVRTGVTVGACTAAAIAVLWYGYEALSRSGEKRPAADTVVHASAGGGGGAMAGAAAGSAPAAVANAVPAAASVPPPAPPPAISLASVTAALSRIPCSALDASVQDHVLQVRGYTEAGVGIGRVRTAISGMAGGQTANLDVRPVDAHNCEIVSALAPYWRSNRAASHAASIRTRAPDAHLAEGNPLVIDITTPGYDSYVNVDYYVLNGSVVHLVPSNRERDNQAPPNYAATIGSMGEWVIGKPFGTEMIVLLVTPAPLFDGMRPPSEPRAAYLAAIERQLKLFEAKYGEGRIAADFVQITTHANGS